MPSCFFATDLHGSIKRYETLFDSIRNEHPEAVFLGGDLIPHVSLQQDSGGHACFVTDYLIPAFRKIQSAMAAKYPNVFLILGNDDPRCEEKEFIGTQADGLWHYAHARKHRWKNFVIYGLAYVPPTPFLLKDWERYDVSRHVPPGGVSPEEGFRSVAVESREIKWTTIQQELDRLVGGASLTHAVCLFHSPPHDTPLDRAALDGAYCDGVALDVHVGSIAIRRFIEERQPLLTLHGHIHESTRLTGEWKHRIGGTVCLNAAHHGPELALVRFDLHSPEDATRELI